MLIFSLIAGWLFALLVSRPSPDLPTVVPPPPPFPACACSMPGPEVGATKRLPLGRRYLRQRGGGRTHGGPAVGEGGRVCVEGRYLYAGRSRGAPGDPQVGPAERMRMGHGNISVRNRWIGSRYNSIYVGNCGEVVGEGRSRCRAGERGGRLSGGLGGLRFARFERWNIVRIFVGAAGEGGGGAHNYVPGML